MSYLVFCIQNLWTLAFFLEKKTIKVTKILEANNVYSVMYLSGLNSWLRLKFWGLDKCAVFSFVPVSEYEAVELNHQVLRGKFKHPDKKKKH